METTMTIMMSVNQVKGFPPKCNNKKQILPKKNRPDDRSLPQLA